jgi:glycosyltransferase involved in cell wall biosynthesis
MLKKYNFGSPSARNLGISYSSGEYLMLLDSDDYLEKNALKVLIENALKHNSDVVISNVNKVNEKGEKIGEINQIILDSEESKLKTFLLNPMPAGKLFKMSIIKDNGLYFDNVKIGQDLNFYMKYCIACNFNVLKIDDYLSNYRIVESSISRTYSYKIFDIIESINAVEKYCKNCDFKIEEKFFAVAKYIHYSAQLHKNKYFKNYKDRKAVIFYLSNRIKEININKYKLDNKTKKILKMVKFKNALKKTIFFYWLSRGGK